MINDIIWGTKPNKLHLVELHKELDFELYFTVREHEGKTYQRVKAYLRV